MDFMTVKDAAESWGLTTRRVQILCNEGRIDNATKVGSVWLIPIDAEKPTDARTTRYDCVGDTGISPLKTSVKAKGHTPQYKMHKYFARRPYNVFNHIIKHYTKKGDIVLDCFCGGGVTVFESAALGRKPIGVDINPLATFITRMQMFNGNVEELKNFYSRFLKTMNKEYSKWYHLDFGDDSGYAVWTEWVYVVKCPDCGREIKLSENNKISNGVYKCENQECSCSKGVKRVLCQNIGSIPVRVLYKSEITGEEKIRQVEVKNFDYFSTLDTDDILKGIKKKPDFLIPENWDRQHEDKLQEKGIISYKDFFTIRNYVLNCLVFDEILKMRGKVASVINEYLYFLFSSSLRYTNNMTRVTSNWENGKPTSMDKHAFWLPNQYVETNILDVLSKRAKTICKGCEYTSSTLPKDVLEVNSFDDLKIRNGYMVLNQSSTALPLPNESISMVITDPPYGSNVQYAELSSIWNAWYSLYEGLDKYIYNDEEAVVNRKSKIKGAKTEEDYERLLKGVFSECNRVLQKEGYLVFTFNNKNLKVWIAMLKAVAQAGFYLPEEGLIYQDYIDSYKNTAHLRFAGNIQGDFIYSFKKGNVAYNKDNETDLMKIIEDAIEITIKKVFNRKRNVTTTHIYQKVMEEMTKRIMEYLVYCINENIPIQDIKELSNDYLENQLRKKLVFEDGMWRKVAEK